MNKFKIGDNAVFKGMQLINEFGGTKLMGIYEDFKTLTIGKSYKVFDIPPHGHYIYIYDDIGVFMIFNSSHFETIQDKRKRIISKL